MGFFSSRSNTYIVNRHTHSERLTSPPQPPRPHRLVSHSLRTARGSRSGWWRMLGPYVDVSAETPSFLTRHFWERCGTEPLIGSMAVLGIRRLALAPSDPKGS